MSKLELADTCYQHCKDHRIHFNQSGRHIEHLLRHEDEEVIQAIEMYVRYNLGDWSLGDSDIDYAKSMLLES